MDNTKKSRIVIFVILIIICLFIVGVFLTNRPKNIAEVGTKTGEVLENENLENSYNRGEDEGLRKDAYIKVLKDIYFNHELPNNIELDYDEYYDISQNKFAIYDVDSDGKDELIIAYTTSSMAGMKAIIYDFDSSENTIKEEFVEFPTLTFYNNGVIVALASHNQGLAGESFWPYTLYKYDDKLDTYMQVGIVDAWDKSISEKDSEGNLFPDEIDKNGDGLVYYIMLDGKYELNTPVDLEEYNEWRKSYINDETVQLDIPYINLTEENINGIK